MKRLLFLTALFIASTATAQWRTESFSLRGGWNAIYLHGDVSYDNISEVLSSGDATKIEEVWRWNANPEEAQFTGSPLVPSAGTPDWSVWKRGNSSASTLSSLIGPAAYLIKCEGDASDTYTVALKQRALPPSANWVRQGANLLGFPTRQNGTYPTFSNYFASFPAAIAANAKIFKYTGGPLGPNNPGQVFSPATEHLPRGTAFWFESEVVGDFYGPLGITSSVSSGLGFGREGSSITLRITNHADAVVTVSLEPQASEAAPTGETIVTGSVPLTRRTRNTNTLAWESTPLTATISELVAPGATIEVHIGIDRAESAFAAAASGASFASLLRITDSSMLTEVFLPVSAEKGSFAGLWVGDIELTNVSSLVSNSAEAIATVSGGGIASISIEGSGGFGYTNSPTVSIVAPPAGGSQASATAVVEDGSVKSITITNPGSGYAVSSPAVTVAPPPPLTNTEVDRPFPLRALLHVASNGTTNLLSQVFLGELAANPGQRGLCTKELLLKQDTKENAQRLTAAHLPLDQAIVSGSGSIAVPGVLARTVTVPFNDATNPFVHQYHPDHDNLDLRFDPLSTTLADGGESPNITRTCTFTFTAAPPSGSTVTAGWGSTVIGGTYSEVLAGPHKNPIQMDGTFELRRASEIDTLSTN